MVLDGAVQDDVVLLGARITVDTGDGGSAHGGSCPLRAVVGGGHGLVWLDVGAGCDVYQPVGPTCTTPRMFRGATHHDARWRWVMSPPGCPGCGGGRRPPARTRNSSTALRPSGFPPGGPPGRGRRRSTGRRSA